MKINDKFLEYINHACQDEFIFTSWSYAQYHGVEIRHKQTENVLRNHAIFKEIDRKEAIQQLIEKKHVDYKLVTPTDDFSVFERIWNQCISEKEQQYFFTLFSYSLHESIFDIDYINKMKQYSFFNKMLSFNMLQHNKSKYPINYLEVLLDYCKDDNNIQDITIENFLIACSTSRAKILNRINVLQQLKDIIVTHFPEHIQEMKVFWKKIETENIPMYRANSSFNININKAQVFSLFKDQSEFFHQGRYKLLVNFLNKSKIKKELHYERVILDGLNTSEKEYSFIFFNVQDEKKLYQTVISILDVMLERDDNLNMDKLQTILQYVSINEQLPENNKKIQQNKI